MKLTLTPEGKLFYKSAEELLAHALKKRLHKLLFYYNKKAENALFPSISDLLRTGDERIELLFFYAKPSVFTGFLQSCY